MKKKQTASQLVRTQPGTFKRRSELILALCQGGVGSVAHYSTQPEVYAKFIVGVANKIIEITE